MAQDTKTTNAKTKVKAKPRASAKKNKPVKDVLNDVDGIVDIVIVDDDLYDIWYDEALLEEAAILAALDDAYYDAELIECDCGC